MDKVILISIKPEFSNLIFKGEKIIELRKSKPKIEPGSIMLVYNTQPDMKVVGFCRLKGLIELSPENIWNQHSTKLGIDIKRFYEYYEGSAKAVGIEIDDAIKFETPIPLKEIKKTSPKFSPPQTFKYLSKENLKFLKQKKNTIANNMYDSISTPSS